MIVTENIRRMGDIQSNCPLWSYCSHGELGLAAKEDGFRDVMIYHLLSPWGKGFSSGCGLSPHLAFHISTEKKKKKKVLSINQKTKQA